MSKYLLGIDNGSTVTKASVFDTDGNEIASFGQRCEMLTPKPGYYERDMNAIWKANVTAIKTVIEKAKINSVDIIGISLTGHGNGLHLIDKEGNPVRSAIEGADGRAVDYIKKWQDNGIFKKVHPRTMQVLWPALSSLVCAWMLDFEPESIEKADWLLMAKDYVRFKLTGVANIEVTDFSGSGLLNTKELRVDAALLEEMGLGKIIRLLPPLLKSTDISGKVTEGVAKVTGLTEGTLVVAGLYDIDAAAVATGVTDESKMNVIAGTWCNNQYIAKKPVVDDTFFSTTAFAKDGYYLMLEGSPTSASNLEWFVQEFLQAEKLIADKQGTSVFDICNNAVKGTKADESEIIFVPFLYGSNAGANAKSVFLGLQGWHKRAHIIRAIYEGICFSHKWHIEKLKHYWNADKTVRFAGGAARSKVWLQMFSDILEMPIEVTKADELGTLGAAVCAGVGIGEFKSFDIAAEKMVNIERRVEPNKDNFNVYNRKFAKYKNAIKTLENYWNE